MASYVALLNFSAYVMNLILPLNLPTFRTLFPMVLLLAVVLAWVQFLVSGGSVSRVFELDSS